MMLNRFSQFSNMHRVRSCKVLESKTSDIYIMYMIPEKNKGLLGRFRDKPNMKESKLLLDIYS